MLFQIIACVWQDQPGKDENLFEILKHALKNNYVFEKIYTSWEAMFNVLF